MTAHGAVFSAPSGSGRERIGSCAPYGVRRAQKWGIVSGRRRSLPDERQDVGDLVVAIATLEAAQKPYLLAVDTRRPEALGGKQLGVLDLGERLDETVDAC